MNVGPEAAQMQYEIIDCITLAERWDLPVSWVRDGVRARTPDPIPHVKLGRYVRFEWKSPELGEWWARHRVTPNRNRGESQKEIRP